LVAAYRVMYQSAQQRGDTAAALEHHIKYAEADKAYLDSVKARELAFQLIRNETQQKTQTIELLNRQNEVLTLQQQVTAKSTQANRLLIALLAVLLASIGYWALKVKKMQVSFRHLAETDALTGISNRHHFTRRATAVLEQCRKSNQLVGLVMVDLDHFKTINDRFGHATGDWALKAVANACREVCRRDDLLGRLGGEEFALLLVGCDADASVALADACRQRIAAIDTLPSGHRFQITASFGVAGSRNCGHAFDALLAKADDALYLSKRDGRDRVSVQDATGEPQAALSG
jgi:diguanylate cyclase (GGDEF)-like protein